MNSNIKIKLDKAFDEFIEIIKEYIDTDTVDLLKQKLYFAGGCIYSLENNKLVNDYDMFCDDIEFIKILQKLDFWKWKSINALSYGRYQVVLKDYGTPEHVAGQFDFMHNMCWYRPYTKKIETLLDDDMLDKYIHSNELHINKERIRDIENVILRLDKFKNRGMTISEEDERELYSRADYDILQTLINSKPTGTHARNDDY